MIASSLPDIFHHANTACLRAQKQGGPFSLHLNNYSTAKHLPSQAGYAPGQLHYLSQNKHRPRAISSQSIKVKSILHNQNTKRTEYAKSRTKVEFKDMDWLENSSKKPKVGMSVVNISNFPYESSRRSVSNNTELEDAENIRNKLQSNANQVTILNKNLQESFRSVDQTRKQLFWLNKNTLNTLDQFQEDFRNALTQCLSNLSTMRRDTNSEVKDNKQHFDKLKTEMNICSSFAKDLNSKTQNLYQQCLDLAHLNSPRSSSSPSRMADFEQISTVRKSSRGATGDQSRKYKIADLHKINETPDLPTDRDNKFLLNGKQIDMLNFEDEL